MKRAWPIVATVAAMTAACLATTLAFAPTPVIAAAPAVPAARASSVTLILAPYLTWDDISPKATPALMRLAEGGAVANVNARSHARLGDQPAVPMECALAISAGSWAVPEWSAPSAYDATETYPGGGTAADAYRRIFGTDLNPARIAYLGLPMTARSNTAASLDVKLGTLGQAISDADGLTAAIGNSDTGSSAADIVPQRPAGIAACDESGTVLYGDVSADLLTTSTTSPYGRHTDLNAFGTTLTRVRQLERAHRGPSLLVLDAGDANRAHDFAWQVALPVAASQHAEAVRTLDAVVGLASASRAPDEVVIVVSQALGTDPTGGLEGLGPFIAAGPGFTGMATSSSTHRSGIVTNLDVPATILDVLGIARPVAVQGNAVTVTSSPGSATARMALLARDNATAIAVDSLKSAVAHDTLIWSVVVILALTALVGWRGSRWPAAVLARTRRLLEGAALLVLCLPVANTLMFALVRWPASSAVALAAFVGAALLAWVCALLLARRTSVRVAVIALALLAAAGIVTDQLLGAPLSFTSILGYSPLVGARFYGIGNEIASLLFGAAMVAIGLSFDEWRGTPLVQWLRRFGVPIAGVVFVIVCAAPMFGANVGVAVWGTVGFGLAWALANGRRVSWRLALGLAIAVVLVVAVFSVIDLVGHGEQTHLARALTTASQGGPSTLLTLFTRKADSNSRVLASTDLTWMLVVTLALFALARWRRGGAWGWLVSENAGFLAMALAAAVAAAVAFFSEDSGIAMGSLMAVYVGLALALRLLSYAPDAAGERP